MNAPHHIALKSAETPSRATTRERYWRTVEELAGTAEFQRIVEREFAPGASEWPAQLDRRSFLTLMAASFALAGLTGCTRQPLEEIVPYVKQPEDLTLGKPLYFATAMPLGGFGTGILVKSREGRPIKADGNPEHPASLGGSSVWIQACLLDLYDPDRAKTVTHFGAPGSWPMFLSDLHTALAEQQMRHGAGLRILTETITSPTLGAQLTSLLKQFPEARWHQYEPIHRDNVIAGSQLAFGDYVATHYDFTRAKTIVALDSDFLTTHPDRLRYARHFTDLRRVATRGAEMNRLYVAEPTPTITGAMADHRLPMSSRQIESAARQLANELGLKVAAGGAPSSSEERRWISVAARELQANRGECVVIAGEFQSAPIHALAHALNAALGNIGRTVRYTAPAETAPVLQTQSLRELVDDMERGRVELLVILGGNPVFNAPADFAFADRLSRVKRPVHLTSAANETSALCAWQIPRAHFLETWSDIRSFDGTATIMQPLIAPLFGGRSDHELLGVMQPLQPERSSYEIVREFWRGQNRWPDFEKGWRRAVHDGVVEGTASAIRNTNLRMNALGEASLRRSNTSFPLTPALSLGERETSHAASGGNNTFGLPESVQRIASNNFTPDRNPILPLPKGEGGSEGEHGTLSQSRATSSSATDSSNLEISFRPDPNLWDGRFANNAWLHETPRPISKLVWDNAALISPQLATREKLSTGDIIELRVGERSVRAPALITPGHAPNSVTLPLGYGRRIAGRAGTNVGFDFFALRTSGAMWFAHGTSLAKSGGRHQLVCTQTHQRLEGEERQIHRAGTLEEFRANPDFVRAHVENPPREETLYEPDQFDYERKWGMAIDLTTCIGCNACLMACNIENNIPVVGRQQVAMSREMLWLRLDTYFEGELENPRIHFQPVPCMHCGNAPCEYVCPVEAAIHDHEGLNLQVYNRCVGTRYCSNNCPYKVRRFNFLHYAHPGPLEALGQNPEVTVRSRGVMEKCTYCVQRISAARIEAKKENRPIRDGEVRTACQEACPANAIVFGIMTDRNSAVAKYKEHPLDFSMLGQLNTRPRTTYLAQLSNPNAALRPPTESRGKNEEREV